MGTAILKIDGELIRRALHLPHDAELVALNGSPTVEVVIHHEMIPDDALAVAAMMRSIHGVTVFDQFLPIGLRGKEQSDG